MNAAGHVLGQLIGLALIPAALIWVLRGTRPGRVVWDAVSPARRRDRRAAEARHVAWQTWRNTLEWWSADRDRHPVGSHAHDAAAELVHYFGGNMPEPCCCLACFPACSGTAFTCTRPHCPSHPRSPR